MIRRIMLSIFLMLTTVSLVAWGLSYTYPGYNSPSYIWRLFNGTFTCQERASSTPRTCFTWHGYKVARKYAKGYGLMNRVLPGVLGKQYRIYVLPLWFPSVGFGVLTMFAYAPIRRRRLRRKRGQCVECGYEMTGNVSGRCPECGVSVEGSGGTPPQPT